MTREFFSFFSVGCSMEGAKALRCVDGVILD